MRIDTRAEGGGYYRVFVNGTQWSRHTMAHKAGEMATDVMAEALHQGLPVPEIYYTHDLEVYYTPEVGWEGLAIPPVSQDPPVSDGGQDIVEFIAGLTGYDPQAPSNEPHWLDPTGDWMAEFIERTKSTWFFIPLVADTDGNPATGEDRNWLGVGWRGYVLLFYGRDRNAIRINVGGSAT